MKEFKNMPVMVSGLDIDFIERIENWGFNRKLSAHFKEVRERVMLRQNFRAIAACLAIREKTAAVRFAAAEQEGRE